MLKYTTNSGTSVGACVVGVDDGVLEGDMDGTNVGAFEGE